MISDLINQLRNNARLRWGVLLIVAIFWLYAILLLRETLLEQQQQHRASAQTISRLRAQLAQPEWITRVAPTRTLTVQLEGRLWQALTAGLAQAAFQEWLKAALTKANVTRPQITVTMIDEAIENAPDQTRAADTPADLWKIKAKLSFDFNATALLSLMEQIESHDKQIVVDALKAHKEPVNRVELELVGHFQKQAATTTPPQQELVPL